MQRLSRERRTAVEQRREGFTLLEILIVAGLMTVTLGSAMNVWFHSQIAFTESVRQNVVSSTGQRLVARLASELMEVDPNGLLPLSIIDSDFVQFQKVEGYDAGGKVLGPVITLGFELETGETANGVDDNGDGRIDEGYVTYTEQGDPTIRICGHVVGLRFNDLANGITISVDVGIVDRDGQVVQGSFTRVIAFRNA